MGRASATIAAGALVAVALAGCGAASAAKQDDPVVGAGSVPAIAAGTTTTATAPTTTTTLPPTTTTSYPPLEPGRVIVDSLGQPFAQVGGVVLVHPSARIEHIGFHQSANEGAQELEVLPTAAAPRVLNTRDRATEPQTAADVVVQPGTEVRAPVTGTVVKAGPYRLYCEYDDDTVVIEPDAHPGWRVVLLHLQDVRVAVGGRVAAGLTIVAGHPHQLPFGSQIDKYRTASPPWPHVHIEVDDPAIPDVPSKGDSCDG